LRWLFLVSVSVSISLLLLISAWTAVLSEGHSHLLMTTAILLYCVLFPTLFDVVSTELRELLLLLNLCAVADVVVVVVDVSAVTGETFVSSLTLARSQAFVLSSLL